MTHRFRSTPVVLLVTEATPLEIDLVLPPGRYKGAMEEHGTETPAAGIVWAPPRYMLRLSAEELTRLGREDEGDAWIEYDLAAFVMRGQVEVIVLGPPAEPAAVTEKPRR